jgi:hypothetical protein
MSKLEILKSVSELAVSIGVSSIVGNAIKMTTDPNAGKFKKLAIGFGGFVLANMVGDAATKYSSQKIDDTADKISRIFGPKETLDITVESDEEIDNVVKAVRDTNRKADK